MHVLGIDAGGTKTVALLADADGQIVGEGRAGAANLRTEGELEVEKILHTVIEQATDGRNVTLAAVCLGMAGVDRQDDAGIIRGVMRRLGFRTNTLIVNDALDRAGRRRRGRTRAWWSFRAPDRSPTA